MKLLFFFLSLLSFLPSIRAQNAVFVATVERDSVGLDDMFSVTFTLVNGSGNELVLNFSKHIEKVGGPSTSTSISISNGVKSQKQTWQYWLKAKKTGPIDIGSATVICDKVKLESNSLFIEVVKGSLPSPARLKQMEDPFPSFFGAFPNFQAPTPAPPKRKIYKL